MRFIVVLSTFFSACCCFSVLNVVFFDKNRQNSDTFYLTEKALLNNTLTDEETLRCQNLTDKIIKEFNQNLIEEGLQEHLSQRKLLLQKISKLFGSKDKNDTNRLPTFENHKNQEHDSYTEQYSTTENSKQVNGTNTEKNKGNSTEKPTDKPEKQKTQFNTMILSSKNMSWSLWNYFFGINDPSKSSNENRSFENFERNPTTESSINLENPNDLENLATEIAPMWKIIMPGTKWCGSGNIAENDDDLGYFKDVDRCCRAHDKCNDIIAPGESKYNLTNTSPFTALNCKCDDELYDCLGQIDSVASNAVGNTFFNIFGRKCYMLDYPRICKKYHILSGCLEYVIDKTAEKIYQWKPAKKYLKMPFTISG